MELRTAAATITNKEAWQRKTFVTTYVNESWINKKIYFYLIISQVRFFSYSWLLITMLVSRVKVSNLCLFWCSYVNVSYYIYIVSLLVGIWWDQIQNLPTQNSHVTGQFVSINWLILSVVLVQKPKPLYCTHGVETWSTWSGLQTDEKKQFKVKKQ